jgi:prepilin-type N-terminal cleavage/methylation domain-containing protein
MKDCGRMLKRLSKTDVVASAPTSRLSKSGGEPPHSKGFTLVELLTVLAIMAIMMTIIIIPVVQSFNLMRAGQFFSDAQNKAAQLVERIGREIGNAAGVRDNAGIRGTLAVLVPGANGAQERILMPYTKLDLFLPAEGEPIRGPSGALINPLTGKEDPTLRAPKGQVVLPVSQGSSLVRYFIARRNPLAVYNNPYDGLLMVRNANQDNLYVLYRAEVQPWVYSRNLGRFVVNKQLFYDFSRDNDPTTSGPWFDDPDFFDANVPIPAYPNPDPDPIAPDPTKQQMIQNWINRATIVTEVSRYDMIQPIFNKANRQVEYLGNVPRIFSLIQFRPTTVSNEPADAMAAVRLSEEGEGMAAFGPDVFRTKMGAWSNVFVRFWPSGWQPGLNQPYEVMRADPNGVAPGLSVYFHDPTLGPDTTSGTELFDTDEYARSMRDGLPYPFSRAMDAANTRSGWITNPALRSFFRPFYPEVGTGKLIGSFALPEYGNGPVVDPDAPFPDMNVQHMNTGPALTPANDTNLAGGIGDPEYAQANGGGPGWQTPYPGGGSSINKNFNKMWADHPELRPNIHRFIDLRVGTLRDGSPSLLNPDPSLGFAQTRIVPGTEVVIGPDQNPGPNYGRLVRYTRTTRTPGPNQYRINYTNLPEPTDYSLIGLPNPPATYTSTDYVSAVIQPRYKAGYIQLNSDPNVPLPEDDPATATLNEGNISVSYRFQMTGSGDTVAVDYDTGQLIQVLLTIKNFPQTTIPNPQTVTLKATATIRNILR